MALVYPQEINAETLLLKTSYSRIIEHGEMVLGCMWKFHLYWVAFIELKGAMHFIRVEK